MADHVVALAHTPHLNPVHAHLAHAPLLAVGRLALLPLPPLGLHILLHILLARIIGFATHSTHVVTSLTEL